MKVFNATCLIIYWLFFMTNLMATVFYSFYSYFYIFTAFYAASNWAYMNLKEDRQRVWSIKNRYIIFAGFFFNLIFMVCAWISAIEWLC